MEQKKKMWLDLQHFADGGEGAAGGEGTGTQMGANNQGDADLGTGGHEDAVVVYGISDETDGSDAADDEGATGADEQENLDEEFEKLVGKSGKFHEAFGKRVQDLISKRFRDRGQKASDAPSITEAHSNVFAELARQYRLDEGDVEGIAKAFLGDRQRLEAEAIERGMSVDELERIKTTELENARFKRQEEVRKAQEEAKERAKAGAERYQGWLNESAALKELYPNFDLQAESKNPEFIKRLTMGLPMREAYEGLHHAELVTSAMAKTAERVEKGVNDKHRINAGRPIEGGSKGSAATVHKSNVNDLTPDDIEEVYRQARAGKKIRF